MSTNLADDIQEKIRDLSAERQREVLEFVDDLRRSADLEESSSGHNGKGSVVLSDYDISLAQAAELRASLATFEDWNAPEMDIYDDYDQALANLDQKR